MKCVRDLNNKLDSETRKVVATRAQLTFQLESPKALVVANGLTKQQMVMDLKLADTKLK